MNQYIKIGDKKEFINTDFTGGRIRMHYTKRDDFRIAKSKEKIINAYLSLLSEKAQSKIMVKDIYTRADVDKSTLYRHFRSINEIESEIEESVLKKLNHLIDNSDLNDFLMGRKSFLRALSEMINNDMLFFSKVLFVNQRIEFVEKIDTRISNKLKDALRAHTGLPEKYMDIVFTFAVAGRVAVYRKWIMGGCKEDINTISEVLEKISSSGFDSFLSNKNKEDQQSFNQLPSLG